LQDLSSPVQIGHILGGSQGSLALFSPSKEQGEGLVLVLIVLPCLTRSEAFEVLPPPYWSTGSVFHFILQQFWGIHFHTTVYQEEEARPESGFHFLLEMLTLHPAYTFPTVKTTPLGFSASSSIHDLYMYIYTKHIHTCFPGPNGL